MPDRQDPRGEYGELTTFGSTLFSIDIQPLCQLRILFRVLLNQPCELLWSTTNQPTQAPRSEICHGLLNLPAPYPSQC
jgi:hypothetical protein